MDILSKFKEDKLDCLHTCDQMIEILNKYSSDSIQNKDKYISQLKFVKNQISDEMIHIPVIAEMSSGKSTFLNALLFGENILDASIGETTAKAFRISYGEKYTIKIQDQITTCSSVDDFKSQIKNINTIARQYIEQHRIIEEDGEEIIVVEDVNKALLVELFLPHPMLKNDIVIYDTPGFGSINEQQMMAVLQSVLPISDGIIWLLDIAQGMKKSDVEIMSKLFQGDSKPSRWFVIYTKLDTVVEIEAFDEPCFEGTIEQIKKTLKSHKEYQKYLKDNTSLLEKHLGYKLEVGKNLFTLGARRFLRKPNSAYGLMFNEFQTQFWSYIIEEKSSIIYEKLNNFTTMFRNIISSIEEQAAFAEQINVSNIEELENLKSQVVILNRIKNSHLPELSKKKSISQEFQGLWTKQKSVLVNSLYNDLSSLSETSGAYDVQKNNNQNTTSSYNTLVTFMDENRCSVNDLILTIQNDFELLGITSRLSNLKQSLQCDINQPIEIVYEKKVRQEIQMRTERVYDSSSAIASSAGLAAGAFVGNMLVSALALTGVGAAFAILAAGAIGSGTATDIASRDEEVEHVVDVEYDALNPEQTASSAAESFFLELERQGFYDFCIQTSQEIESLVEQLHSECEHLIYITENLEQQENYINTIKEKMNVVLQLKQDLLSIPNLMLEKK